MATWTDRERLNVHKERLRQCELRMDAQVRFAMSADQRGVYVATIFAAFASGLLAIIAGLVTSSSPSATSFIWGLGVMALLLFLAVALALASIRPQGFYVPGTAPDEWNTYIQHNTGLADIIAQFAEEKIEECEHNDQLLASNGTLFWHAVSIGFVSPIPGLVAFGLARL
jgi:hypothetical protein